MAPCDRADQWWGPEASELSIVARCARAWAACLGGTSVVCVIRERMRTLLEVVDDDTVLRMLTEAPRPDVTKGVLKERMLATLEVSLGMGILEDVLRGRADQPHKPSSPASVHCAEEARHLREQMRCLLELSGEQELQRLLQQAPTGDIKDVKDRMRGVLEFAAEEGFVQELLEGLASVPAHADEHGTPPMSPLPPRVRGGAPRKFDEDGRFLPFRGVSIVAMIARLPGSWANLPGLVSRSGPFVPLPVESYHVTFLDGITAPSALSCAKPDDTEWEAYLAQREPRLARAARLLSEAAFTPTLRLEKVGVGKTVIAAVFTLEPSEEERAAKLERDLMAALGLDKGRKVPFHVSLGYWQPGASTQPPPEVVDGLKAAVEIAMGGPTAVLQLERVHLSSFLDLTAFPPWRPVSSLPPSSGDRLEFAPALVPAWSC